MHVESRVYEANFHDCAELSDDALRRQSRTAKRPTLELAFAFLEIAIDQNCEERP